METAILPEIFRGVSQALYSDADMVLEFHERRQIQHQSDERVSSMGFITLLANWIHFVQCLQNEGLQNILLRVFPSLSDCFCILCFSDTYCFPITA
jgi:hypothetical protein